MATPFFDLPGAHSWGASGVFGLLSGLTLLLLGCTQKAAHTESTPRASQVEVNHVASTATIAPSAEREAPTASREPPLRDDFKGTAGIVKKAFTGKESTVLKSVRTGRHEHFDRVVFEFDVGLPGYHVEYVDKPVRQCGSGDTMPVAGDGWLQVRMTPARAHTEEGRPTIPEQERALELGVLRELQRTCDFEGEVTYVLGAASPNHFRVIELNSPPRLVVDVRHRR